MIDFTTNDSEERKTNKTNKEGKKSHSVAEK